jgi:hypothetical protein
MPSTARTLAGVSSMINVQEPLALFDSDGDAEDSENTNPSRGLDFEKLPSVYRSGIGRQHISELYDCLKAAQSPIVSFIYGWIFMYLIAV